MGQPRARFRSPSPGQGKACGSITRSAVAATSSSSSRSSAAARLSTLSTMRRNIVSELRNGHHSSRPASRPAPRQTVDDDGDDEKRIEQALAIWCDARPLRGTLAEKYLRSRCIEVPGEALEVLRFHPRCPWGIGTRPAMVALVRDIITDEPTGIHRTALSADGSKLAAQGSRPESRRRDQAVALDGRQQRTPDRRRHRDHAVGIDPRLWPPAWSVIDAGEMSRFPGAALVSRGSPSSVDNDVKGAGERAAAETRRDGRPRACGSAP